MANYAAVAVPLGVRSTFTYSVPSHLREHLQIGIRVVVPFGRKLRTGFVVALSSEPPPGDFRIRAIRDVLDRQPLISSALVETALWISEYYFTPPGSVLAAILPAGTGVTADREVRLSTRADALLRGGLRPALARQEDRILRAIAETGAMTAQGLSKHLKIKNLDKSLASLQESGWVVLEERWRRPRVAAKTRLGIRTAGKGIGSETTLTATQNRLYSLLGPEALPLQSVLQLARTTLSVARTLERNRLVEIVPLKVDRSPPELEEQRKRKRLVFTDAQQKSFAVLLDLLRSGSPQRSLLHGVTGSGKTEIYLRLIGQVLNHGESAILLVPEIGLTPLLSRIAVSHFPDQVALLHSGMSVGERFDQWNRIRSGDAKVVVGTRSAVFAPMEDVRLIILDEEHDTSYKQDVSPCYHAREVAWHRLQQSSGLLLLGSATPSMETFYAAKDLGTVTYLNLPERIEARSLPEVEIVDMSVEFQRHGKKTVISDPLRQGLTEKLERNEQAIILLNRRGYSRSLLCRSCGHVFICSDCSISMTYHQDEHILRCHYCGREQDIPQRCRNCEGEFIYYVGVGTEQLEEIVHKIIPRARLARVDRDTTRRRGSLRKMLLDFSDGKLDVLVGTQMLSKGHDFQNLTLVGVVSADAGLSFPDFRSAERTFQLLTQVAGRAGRGKVAGHVVIQSFYPDHYALRFARQQDFVGFYNREIEYRRLLGYPPFKDLIQILIKTKDADKGRRIAEQVSGVLRRCIRESKLKSKPRILGPAVAPLEKLRGEFRHQILVKSSSSAEAIPILHEAFEQLGRQRVALKNIHVDVDPISLL